jgi:SAM-dependent methyltransferase
MTTPDLDRELVWAFIERMTGLVASTTTLGLLAVADRTGMLRAMAGAGPITAEALAVETDLEARYVTEILSGLAAAEILLYQPEGAVFTLSDEHAACLADDDSPYSMVGWMDVLPEVLAHVPRVVEATRHGGGVAYREYDDIVVAGIDRLNGPSYRHLLTRRWLRALPDVVARLEAGAAVADVGCGSGQAVVAMAEAYPASRFFGYDLDERSIVRANSRAAAANVDNAWFEVRPAEEIPTEPGFELITTFDVVHDLASPDDCLRRIHAALTPGGTYLLMEPRVAPDLEDNVGDRSALVYGLSTLFCMTQSLAEGGPGLGMAWGPRRAEESCRRAGFSSFEELPIDNPFSAFYRVEA